MKKYFLLFTFLISWLCHADENIQLLIPPEKITTRLEEISGELIQEYKGKELTIIMIMKGAICITADLIRVLNMPCTLEFIKASSYGMNGASSASLTISGIDHLDLAGKDVLLVDDIFDTGKTMSSIVDLLRAKNPNSLKTLVLLLKKKSRHIGYRPDYALFEIDNRFVIGYGLDYKEYYRGLSGIYAFVNDTPPSG